MSMDKKKTIKFETIAKQYTDPKQFEEDCLNLASKIQVHTLKYGLRGMWVVEKMIENIKK